MSLKGKRSSLMTHQNGTFLEQAKNKNTTGYPALYQHKVSGTIFGFPKIPQYTNSCHTLYAKSYTLFIHTCYETKRRFKARSWNLFFPKPILGHCNAQKWAVIQRSANTCN